MPVKTPSITNIALVGGGEFCREILEKTTSVYEQEGVYAPILAVADPDPKSPGIELADELGLLMIIEGAIWNDDSVYRINDPVFWDNYASHLKAMIDRVQRAQSKANEIERITGATKTELRKMPIAM